MHLGRFHAAVRALRDYYVAVELVPAIDRGIEQLQPYIANRNAANLSAFRSILTQVAAKARATPSSFLLPSVEQIYEGLGASKWYGDALADQLSAVTTGSGLLVEEMIAKLSEIKTSVGLVINDIVQLTTLLEKRGVEVEELDGEQAELGIAFPKTLVGERLGQVRDELKHVDALFSCVAELMGASEASPKLRTISSSWWQFFLELDAAQITFWTVTIERIVNLLKTNLEVKKLLKELEEKKPLLPEGVIEQMEAHILQNIKLGVGLIAADLRAQFGNNPDKERCNELETQLRIELLQLVRRINGGAAIEVRLGAPELTSEQTAAQEGEQEPAVLLARERAQLNVRLAGLSRQASSLELTAELQLEAPEPPTPSEAP